MVVPALSAVTPVYLLWSVQVLAYATLMLNVSLHNPKLRERDRMTQQAFLSMLRGCDNGADLPPELLESIFASIEADGIMVWWSD